MPTLVGLVHVRVRLEQRLHNRRVVILGRQVQRRLSFFVGLVHVRAVIDEQLHRIRVAIIGRHE